MVKRILLLTILIISSLQFVEARGRDGYTIKGNYEDNGDTRDVYAATIGTTTPVQVYFSTWTQSINYRNIIYQNDSASYRVYIGTHSNLSATSGERWFIPAGGSWTTQTKEDLWMLFDTGLGSGTEEIFGVFERDTADADVTNR